ncbi:MAG TPA: ABC transporter ATP-binding protein [Thermodesulfobacteriota bacterium]|nr:ABC transporter ATP-binding protein [Thermodesulfobacteriota bacterium]
MLKVNSVSVSYGKLQALRDVGIEVAQDDFVAVIGSNGAGKTTLLRAISGLTRISAGSIEFKGERLDGLPPKRICEIGIIQVPEGRKIFPFMKVGENLQLGAYLPRPRKLVQDSLSQVFQLFPVLKERQNQLAKTLSGGEQQMLAIGRGLMSCPLLLILDEPTLGLSPKLAAEMLMSLKQLKERGITILLVSQEVIQSLQLAQRAYVLDNGRIALQGRGTELAHNEHIRKAYLGL